MIFMVLSAKVVLIACCPILLSGIIGCYLPIGNSTFRGLYFNFYYVPHFL